MRSSWAPVTDIRRHTLVPSNTAFVVLI
jgi:hypothetical protein